MNPFDVEEFRKLNKEAESYLKDYQEKHKKELAVLEKDSKIAEKSMHFLSRFAFTDPVGYSRIFALMITHFSRPKTEETFAQRFHRALNGRQILEIGARYGTFVKFLNDEGIEAEGIDPDTIAHSVTHKHGIPIRQIGYLDLEPDRKYDAVVSKSLTCPDALNGLRFSDKEMAKKISDTLKTNGMTAHVVFGNETTMDPRYLEQAGLQIIHHGSIDRYHMAVAYRI